MSVTNISMYREIRDLRTEIDRLNYLKYLYEGGDNYELEKTTREIIERKIYRKLPEKISRLDTMKKVMNLMKGE